MRFRITDDNGEKFEVEEINDDVMMEEEQFHDDDEFIEEEIHDEEASFTPEEIDKLRGLLAVADKLMGLVSTNDEEEEIDETIGDEDEEEVLAEDEDEEIDETVADEDIVEEEEEVVDTAPISDSFGSMEKKAKRTKDSAVDKQTEISNAWSNKYANFNRNK